MIVSMPLLKIYKLIPVLIICKNMHKPRKRYTFRYKKSFKENNI